MRSSLTSAFLTVFLPIAMLGCMGAAGGDKYAEAPASTADWGSTGFGGQSAPGDMGGDMGYRGAKSDLSEMDDGLAWEDGEDAKDIDRERSVSGEVTSTNAPVTGKPSEDPPKAKEGRKLIRTGSISVLVDDYDPFQAELDKTLTEMGGFVSNANLDHWSGRVSYATLTLRVPADRFEELVSWTESQVEVQSLNVGTSDVTAEWVDVKARIDNGKKTERRLQEILKTDTANLADILAVERELARVRGEIESAEGRMRVLSDQVSLATLTVSISVRNPYTPAVDPPGFGQRIADVFLDSIDAMIAVGKGLVLLGTALAPWLALFGILAYGLYRTIRFMIRMKSA